MTLVSVIMAVYNVGDSVGAAVESIQQQTWTDWELLVVDDASTDNTEEVLRTLAKQDSRIKVSRHAQNLGLAASLNEALESAIGELIARMDGDDISLPNRLTQQVAFLHDHSGVDVLGGGAIEVDAQGRVLGETCRRERHIELVARIYQECPFIHPTVMGRRAFWVSLGGYNVTLRRAQDYDLWLRGYRKFHYHNLQSPLVYYRRHQPSVRNALYSAWVLWRAAWRERKLLTHGCYALRPLVATFFAVVQTSAARAKRLGR